MKLIDVDGIKDSLLPELLSGVDGGTDDSYLKTYEVIDRIEKIVNEWVDNQSTVDTIPVEWIEKYIADNTHIVADSILTKYYDLLPNCVQYAMTMKEIEEQLKKELLASIYRCSLKLDTLPTVDAIPVEWIKKWGEENWELECDYILDTMLEDWEKRK